MSRRSKAIRKQHREANAARKAELTTMAQEATATAAQDEIYESSPPLAAEATTQTQNVTSSPPLTPLSPLTFRPIDDQPSGEEDNWNWSDSKPLRQTPLPPTFDDEDSDIENIEFYPSAPPLQKTNVPPAIRAAWPETRTTDAFVAALLSRSQTPSPSVPDSLAGKPTTDSVQTITATHRPPTRLRRLLDELNNPARNDAAPAKPRPHISHPTRIEQLIESLDDGRPAGAEAHQEQLKIIGVGLRRHGR